MSDMSDSKRAGVPEDSVENTAPSKSSGKASFLSKYKENYERKKSETMSLTAYLDLCKEDKMAYANWAERLLAAIGEPEVIDTAKEKGRLQKIHQSETIRKYKTFSDFYGADDTIQDIVNHLEVAAKGGAAAKRILFFLGPPSGGKSSITKRLKQLMEENPIYVLKAKKQQPQGVPQISPINESPLGLFTSAEMRKDLSGEFGIPSRYMEVGMSPWATKRLEEAGGDLEEAFEVVKLWPSMTNNVAIAKVEAKDANNQDTGDLVGQVDMNMLGEGLPQNDTDVYLYDGGLCRANQGMMEFVEMLKAPIQALNPLLEATEDRAFKGNENVGVIPFDGLLVAHTNENEWNKFSKDGKNEAFLSRMNLVKVPYTLRKTEEAAIYQKELDKTEYASAPIAPKTVELLAEFSVMTRLSRKEELARYTAPIRMTVLNGEIPDSPKGNVPTISELQSLVNKHDPDEGMNGSDIRFALDTLTATFNAEANKNVIEADPVLLFKTLKKRITKADMHNDKKEHYIGLLDEFIIPKYLRFIGEEISMAYSNASDEACQSMFEQYIAMADAWLHEEDYDDQHVSGEVLSRDTLEKKLSAYEKAAGIPNGKDFRQEVVSHVQRRQSRGETVRWDAYEKMGNVIRETLKTRMKDFEHVVKFDVGHDTESRKKLDDFVENMKAKGYTETMVKRAVALHNQRTLG